MRTETPSVEKRKAPRRNVGASSYSNIRIETAKSLSDARQIDSILVCKEAESGSRMSYAVMHCQDRWLHKQNPAYCLSFWFIPLENLKNIGPFSPLFFLENCLLYRCQ